MLAPDVPRYPVQSHVFSLLAGAMFSHRLSFLGLAAVAAVAQGLPTPTPDPITPNIFYGATPPNGNAVPVIVFVHGLQEAASVWWNSNDMYSTAYSAGFRTAFLSINENNSPNITPWQQNGLTLKPLFQRIAAYYNVRNFYIVAHGKGGLDTQAALLQSSGGNYTALDPQIAPLAKAVFTLGTPNQGTPLADWAFGSGQSTAQGLGLVNPGFESLEVATVEAFRSQADPLFTTGLPGGWSSTPSLLEFYTLGGNTGAGNSLLQFTSNVLSNIVSGPNDGMVPLHNTALPFAYSMDIGQTNANDYQLNQGSVSFGSIDGVIQGIEKQMPGFQRVVTNGFGDPHNTWAWSMAWFNRHLYVGTGRDVGCIDQASSLPQFALSGQEQSTAASSSRCPSDPKDLSLAAEIWQYTPETKSWVRVFRSALTIPIGQDSSGQNIITARDIGFRGMAVFTEADGTQALYVAGVTSAHLWSNLAPYNTQGYPPPRILRTVDGINFTAVPQDPGTFLGDITLNSPPGYQIASFRSMAVLNGTLYVTATDPEGVGYIVGSSNPSKGDNAWFAASPAPSVMPVFDIATFNNLLYATGQAPPNQTGYFVSYTKAQGQRPYTFQDVITNNGGSPGTQAGVALKVFNNRLYVGTGLLLYSQVVAINPDNSWELVFGAPFVNNQGQTVTPISGVGSCFDNQFSEQVWVMDVVPSGAHQGLYVSQWDGSVNYEKYYQLGNLAEPDWGGDVLTTNDAVHWTAVTTTGFGDGINYGIRSLASTPFGNFMGTARVTGGLQIWLDQTVLDLNGDGVIDQNDVNMIVAAEGQAASPNDPMDLDEDGLITAKDAYLESTQCTLPGCATPSPLADVMPAPTNLWAADPHQADGMVSLTWDPVPGAVAYHVYRQTQTPILQFFPTQGIQITVNGQVYTLPQDALSGQLAFTCTTGGLLERLCTFVTFIQDGAKPGSTIGFPTVLVEVSRTTGTSYQETPPTPLQSIYFVRAEDALGNLSGPSNSVGAPSIGAIATTAGQQSH